METVERVTRIGSSIIRLDRVDSTNDYLKRISKTVTEGAVVYANEQTRGRGRGKNSWLVPRGKGLTMSILLSAPAEPVTAPRFNIFPAVAIVDCLRALHIDAHIKWPNDIILRGRKIGGILVESISRQGKLKLILGIGLNVRQEPIDFPDSLRPFAGSLKSLTGTEYDIGFIFEMVLEKMDEIYAAIQTLSGWQNVREKWNDYCGHIGRPVAITSRDSEKIGIFIGIDENGFAVIEGEQQFIVRDYTQISLMF